MNEILNSVICSILGLFLPKKVLITTIERMTAEEFTNHAKLADMDLTLSFPSFTLFSYRNQLVRKAIHEIKYKKNRKIAVIFAEILKYSIPLELEDEISYANFNDPIIVPIPSHKKKQNEKGYNQTEFILESLKKISSYEIIPALTKIKHTEDQTRKNRDTRLKNIQHCFEVKEEVKELIRGRNIIIFDDVVTTGATLTEAHRALKKARARRVVGLTLAH